MKIKINKRNNNNLKMYVKYEINTILIIKYILKYFLIKFFPFYLKM